MAGNFRKGAEAAAEASKGGRFARTQYFSLKDGDSVHLRFLTEADDWITVDQHHMVPTKPKPEGYKGDSWPERMAAVCRKDTAFEYGECYICDFLVKDDGKVRSASGRVWALACLREEVIEDGKVKGIRDVIREVTIPAREAKDDKPAEPEKKVEEKAVVVVNLGYKNFFSILQGFAGKYGSIVDRDYYVKRQGADQSTVYHIVPESPISDKEGEVISPLTHLERWPHDYSLETIISERASDEFYARFFDPRVTVSDDGETKETGVEAPKPETEVSPEKLEALQQRVRRYNTEMDEVSSEEESKESALADLG